MPSKAHTYQRRLRSAHRLSFRQDPQNRVVSSRHAMLKQSLLSPVLRTSPGNKLRTRVPAPWQQDAPLRTLNSSRASVSSSVIPKKKHNASSPNTKNTHRSMAI